MCATHYTPEQRATGPIECQRPASRRGATLVLVLGALALISILTIVYVSVGRADRRTSAAATESTQRNANVERFIEHIGGVIGDDVTSTYIESVGANGPRFARETVDLPVTSPGFVSVVPSIYDDGDRVQEIDRFRFRPEGSITREWVAPADRSFGINGFLGSLSTASGNTRIVNLDYRSISDPFLAQTLPTDIDGDAVRLAASGADAAALLYLERRDWGHISNFAPDGRFVNLYNLRADANYANAGDGPNPWSGVLGNSEGGFNAPSGFSVGTVFDLETQLDDPEIANLLGISDGLTLWEPRGNVTDPWIAETEYRSPGDSLTAGIDLTGGAGLAMINLPYVWDTNQRELFRPASDLPDDPGWDNPTYWQYQYADADGDGFLDSRWQELVDASDARNIRNLAGGGEYRLFFAARAIDLSSLVNVNTAADFSASPTAADGDRDPLFPLDQTRQNRLTFERIGASPGEIDLRRILSMEDVWFDVARDNFAASGYAGFVQPRDLPSGNPGDDGDYANYRSLIIGASGNLVNGPGYLGARGAVASIRRTLFDAVTPPSGPQASSQYAFNTNLPDQIEQLSDPNVGLFSTTFSPYESVPTTTANFTPIMDIGSRVGNFNQFSGVYPGSNAGGTGSSALFGVDDLGELLAFWGANDDEVTTRLEVAAGGRGASLNAVGDAYHLSPLRSDRPLDLELTRGNWDGDDRYEFAEAQRDLLWSLFNARRYLTTVSGARPFAGEVPISEGFLDRSRAGTVFAGDTRRYVGGSPANGGLAYDLPVPAADTEINPLNEQAARNAFQIYRDLLLPYESEIAVAVPGDVWTLNPSMSTPFAQQTESYGYRGPAFAARLAAHMAANVVDQIDRDPIRDPGTSLFETFPLVTAIRLGQPSTGTPTPFAFDNEINVTNQLSPQASTAAGLPGEVEDVVVFGVEAQPFIVEATSFSAYVDTPFANGGDQDWNPSDNGATPFSGVVTINSDVDPSNLDFLFQVFAVQISNPFETRVRFNDLYIEYADHLYALNEDVLSTAATSWLAPDTIGAGDTVIAYAVTPGRDEITNRVQAATGDASFDIDAFIQDQLVDGATPPLGVVDETISTGTDVTIFEMKRLSNGGTPFSVGVGATEVEFPVDILPDDADVADIFAGGGPSAQTVLLWRKSNSDPVSRVADVLVDRLASTASSLGALPVFDAARLNEDSVPVGDAVGMNGAVMNLFENATTSTDEPSNIYAAVFVDSLVRPADPTGATGRAGLPAWTVEVKATSSSLNTADSAIGTDRDSIAPMGMPAGVVVNDGLLQGVELDGSSTTINQLPEAKGNVIPMLTSSSPTGASSTISFDSRYLELAVSGGSSLRTGDLLLPLAVGPFFKESVNAAGPRLQRLEDQWTTLGEAIALALGYAQEVSPNTAVADSLDGIGGEDDPVTLAFNIETAKLDNGRLDLDRYVLFTDSDAPGVTAFNGVYEPVLSGINAVTGRYNEQTRGLAIPAALRIFSLVTAGDELATYGNAERPLMGTVNLNTAPLAVLRTLPTLSPANSVAAGNGFAPTFDHWWPERQEDALASPMVPAANWPGDSTNSGTDRSQAIDIASTVQAYRDRTRNFARPPQNPPPGNFPGGARPPINDFFTFTIGSGVETQDPLFIHPDRLLGRNIGVANDGVTQIRRAAIDGMREALGLLSVGELFGARIARTASESDLALITTERRRELLRGTDGLANDGASLITRGGVDYVGYFNNPDTLMNNGDEFIESDTIVDDYEEQLVVLNALANTASVRSDFYAVWMIVQGFRESDVTDLSPSEPLTPSFRDRYLLVFDRSNVTEAGDQPRLVYRRLLKN